MLRVDDPKLEEIQVVGLMDGHPAGATRVARLKLEANVAIRGDGQALFGESQDATIEGLSGDRLAGELHWELDRNCKKLLRPEAESLKNRIVLRGLENRLVPVIDRRGQSARGFGFQPITILGACAAREPKQTAGQ